jgi:uncharacterized protein (DUF2225 family)
MTSCLASGYFVKERECLKSSSERFQFKIVNIFELLKHTNVIPYIYTVYIYIYCIYTQNLVHNLIKILV